MTIILIRKKNPKVNCIEALDTKNDMMFKLSSRSSASKISGVIPLNQENKNKKRAGNKPYPLKLCYLFVSEQYITQYF